MKKLLLSVAWIGLSVAVYAIPASSAGIQSIAFCDCCASPDAASCTAPCEQNAGGKQCLVKVVYDAKAMTKANKLNGISLKELDLGQPSRAELEQFRKFLEKERRKAQAVYRKSERAFNRKRISQAELETAKVEFSEAMVNYNHGIFAYREATGGGE